MEEKIFISIEKKKELEKELDNLINKGRHEIASRLDEAKALGDLSENAEYHQAREDQSHLESRINEIEYVLKYAEIVKKNNSNTVEVGSEVTIVRKDTKKKIVYKIVGVQEADVFEGKIAFSSPLATAIIGKSKNEEFHFETPNGEKQYFNIVDIK